MHFRCLFGKQFWKALERNGAMRLFQTVSMETEVKELPAKERQADESAHGGACWCTAGTLQKLNILV